MIFSGTVRSASAEKLWWCPYRERPTTVATNLYFRRVDIKQLDCEQLQVKFELDAVKSNLESFDLFALYLSIGCQVYAHDGSSVHEACEISKAWMESVTSFWMATGCYASLYLA